MREFIITQKNAHLNKHARLSSNRLPSRTVPDMSLTIRQMLDRHNSGGKVKTFEPVFVKEDSLVPDNLERMDRVERAQFLKSVGDFVATTRGRLQTAKQAADKAAYEASVAAAADKLVIQRLEALNSADDVKKPAKRIAQANLDF